MRSLRIVKERYGPARMRLPPEDSARFRAAAPSATERTAVSAAECSPCMRTAEAISGRERRPDCGDGSLVLRSSIRCQTPQSQRLIEGDNGALLIAMRGGIRQLVDGKAEAYPLPGAGRAVHPHSLLRDRNGGLWIGTTDHGPLACPPGKDGSCLRGLTVSPAIRYSVSLRIGKAIFGSPPVDGLDRFRDFAVPTISVKQGLSNATVGSVLAARDGSVWLGTSMA